jgi:hypothetical protein
VSPCGGLLDAGWIAAAQEVTLPNPRMHADFAAWTDRLGRVALRPARTAIVECKATRADFLRDAHDVRDLLKRRANLHEAIADCGISVRRLLRPLEAGDGGLFDGVNTQCDALWVAAPSHLLRRRDLPSGGGCLRSIDMVGCTFASKHRCTKQPRHGGIGCFAILRRLLLGRPVRARPVMR